MRAILGDPTTRTLVEADLPDSEAEFMEACRSLLGAPYLEMAILNDFRDGGPVAAWVDEEGLFRSGSAHWSTVGATAPIAGRFVLSGLDDGCPVGLARSLAEVRATIKWWDIEDAAEACHTLWGIDVFDEAPSSAQH